MTVAIVAVTSAPASADRALVEPEVRDKSAACCISSASVKKMDKCGRAGDAFLAKRVRGVTYLVRGDVIREGVWLKARRLTVKVLAMPTNEEHGLVGEDVWTLRFTNKPCPTPPQVLPDTGA